MKLKYLALVASSALFFSACTASTTMAPEPSPSPEAMMPKSSPVAMMPKTIQLTEQNKSGQTGTAVMSEGPNGNAVVTLTMTGGKFTAPQPAHIHLGSCPTPGAVKYPLTDVVNGKSVTTLDASFEDVTKATDKMAVNVHQSATDAKVYTACGDVN